MRHWKVSSQIAVCLGMKLFISLGTGTALMPSSSVSAQVTAAQRSGLVQCLTIFQSCFLCLNSDAEIQCKKKNNKGSGGELFFPWTFTKKKEVNLCTVKATLSALISV